MKIALFTKYSRLGASSRLRSLQYLPYLQEAGIDVQVLPLFDDTYLRGLYSGAGRSSRAIFKYYLKRIQALFKLDNVELLWLEKEMFPFIPYWIEKLLMPVRIPYVVDYDDAIFHKYDLSGNLAVRYLLKHKIDKVMVNASTVVCGNRYLADSASSAGARRIEVLPTAVDISRYVPSFAQENQVPVIGWIGSPTTQEYVRAIKTVLKRVCRDGRAKLVLVGATPEYSAVFNGISIEIVPWHEATEPEMVGRFDIGIMPLLDGPWELGKCGYKLLQYMACGLPVVASRVGANKEIVEDGTSGFLVEKTGEWIQALTTLIDEPELRRRMGLAGRRKIEETFCSQVVGPRYVEIIKGIISK